MKKLLVLALLIFTSGYQASAKDTRCSWCNSNYVKAANCNAEFYTCSYCYRTISTKEAELLSYDNSSILGTHYKHYHNYRCPYCNSISKINMETGGTDQQDAVKFQKGCDDIRQLKRDLPGAGCFIATACYGSNSNEVFVLSYFRDKCLYKSAVGRLLIRLYYRYSPGIAKWIGANSARKCIARIIIWPFVKIISIY